MIKTDLTQIISGQNNIGKLLLFKFEQTTLVICVCNYIWTVQETCF